MDLKKEILDTKPDREIIDNFQKGRTFLDRIGFELVPTSARTTYNSCPPLSDKLPNP